MAKSNNGKAETSSTPNILQLPTDVIGMARNRLSTISSMFRCPESPRPKQKAFAFNYFQRTRSPDKYKRQASEVSPSSQKPTGAPNILRRQSSVDEGRLSRSLPNANSSKPAIESICLFPRLVLPLKGTNSGGSAPAAQDQQDGNRPRKKLSFREPEVVGAVKDDGEVKSNVAEVIEVAAEAAALAAAAWNIDDDLFVMDDDDDGGGDENDTQLENLAMEIVHSVGRAFELCQKLPSLPVDYGNDKNTDDGNIDKSNKNNEDNSCNQTSNQTTTASTEEPLIMFEYGESQTNSSVLPSRGEKDFSVDHNNETTKCRVVPIGTMLIHQTSDVVPDKPLDLTIKPNPMSNKKYCFSCNNNSGTFKKYNSVPADLDSLDFLDEPNNRNGIMTPYQFNLPSNSAESSRPILDPHFARFASVSPQKNTTHEKSKPSSKHNQYQDQTNIIRSSITDLSVPRSLPQKKGGNTHNFQNYSAPQQTHVNSKYKYQYTDSVFDQPSNSFDNGNQINFIYPSPTSTSANYVSQGHKTQQPNSSLIPNIPISQLVPKDALTFSSNNISPPSNTSFSTSRNPRSDLKQNGVLTNEELIKENPRRKNLFDQVPSCNFNYNLTESTCFPTKPQTIPTLRSSVQQPEQSNSSNNNPTDGNQNVRNSTTNNFNDFKLQQIIKILAHMKVGNVETTPLSVAFGTPSNAPLALEQGFNEPTNFIDEHRKFCSEFNQVYDRAFYRRDRFRQAYRSQDAPDFTDEDQRIAQDEVKKTQEEFINLCNRFRQTYHSNNISVNSLLDPDMNFDDVIFYWQRKLNETTHQLSEMRQDTTENEKKILEILENMFTRLAEDEAYIYYLMERLDDFQEQLFNLYRNVWAVLKNGSDFKMLFELFHSVYGCNQEKMIFLNSYNKLNKCLDYLTLCISSMTIDYWPDECSMNNNDLPQLVRLEHERMVERAKKLAEERNSQNSNSNENSNNS